MSLVLHWSYVGLDKLQAQGYSTISNRKDIKLQGYPLPEAGRILQYLPQ